VTWLAARVSRCSRGKRRGRAARRGAPAGWAVGRHDAIGPTPAAPTAVAIWPPWHGAGSIACSLRRYQMTWLKSAPLDNTHINSAVGRLAWPAQPISGEIKARSAPVSASISSCPTAALRPLGGALMPFVDGIVASICIG